MTFSTTTEFKQRGVAKDATDRLLADIRELAPDIQSRSGQMEASGRIPTDLIESLKAIGVFRMFVPRSHDGLELDFTVGIEIIQALARIDGAVGWIAAITSGVSVMSTFLPPEIYDRIYQNGPDVTFAGSLKPGGKAEAMGNSWRLNARFDFSSGCQHADWIFCSFVMSKNGVPLVQPNGPPFGATCVRVANDCFALGGSNAVYESSALQRRLRDLLVGSQHFVAQKRQYVTSGKLLLEPDLA